MILAVISYPITGPLRELLFVLEMLVMFFSEELAILFFYRYWKARKNPEEKGTEIIWTLLLAGWGGMWGFIVLGDFFTATPEIRIFMLLVGFIICGITMFLFSMFGEKGINRGYKFTFIFSLMFAGFSVCLVYPGLLQPYTLGAGAIFILTVTVYLVRINRYARFGPKYYLSLALGNICLYMGFFGTMDFLVELTGTLMMRVITDCTEIAGLFLLALFFTYVPNFSEFNWRNRVKFIILFEKESGTVIFSQKMTLEFYNIGAKQAHLDEYLIASALTGVKLLLEQVNMSKGNAPPVKSFKQENAFVCLEYGQKFALAAICESPSTTLERLMKVFLRKVDVIYQNALKTWKGDSRVFDSIKYLFRSIFLPPNMPNPNRLPMHK